MKRAAHRAIHRAMAAFVPSDGATPYRPAKEAGHPEEFFHLDHSPEIIVEKVRRIRLGGPDMLRKSFAFPSPVRSGVVANDTVRGYWFTPVATPVQGTMVFLHGWKAMGLRRLQRVARYAINLGAEVFLPAHPYHVWRRPKMTYSGIPLLTPDLDRTLRSMRQAVLDVRSLVSWIDKRDQGPLLLAGVDLGGLVAGLTATVHDGLSGLAVIASHDRVSEMLWRGKADRGKFREAMEHAGVKQTQVDEAWSVLDPGWRPPLVPLDHIRLVEGCFDDVEHACLDRLSQSWGDVEISRHSFAHADFPFFARPVIKEVLGLIGLVES